MKKIEICVTALIIAQIAIASIFFGTRTYRYINQIECKDRSTAVTVIAAVRG